MTIIFERPTLDEAKAEAIAWVERHAPDEWNHITVERLADSVRITVEVEHDRG